MDLKELLGDSYHEGITVDEISTALAGKKLADLSTGAYVGKEKSDAALREKDAEITKLKSDLKSRMTADEQAQNADKEKDDLIESLKKQIADSQIQNSRVNAATILAGSKTLLGIKDEDADYSNFLSGISTSNIEGTTNMAKYINKLIQDSYAKGQKDATRDGLGKFGKDVGTSGTGGKEPENLGRQIAKAYKKDQVDSDYYFRKQK